MERDAAVIERLGIIRPNGQRAVVACERLFRPPQQPQYVAAVVERFGVIGPAPQNRRIAGKRLVETAEILEKDGAIVMRVGVIRIGPKRRLIARKSLGGAFQVFEYIAAVDQRFGVIGTDRQRKVVARQGRDAGPAAILDKAEQAQRIEVTRLLFQRQAAHPLGIAMTMRVVSGDRFEKNRRRARHGLGGHRVAPAVT